jgi:ubiquinone/menaquinone biosynthesis C-methylase UbiE
MSEIRTGRQKYYNIFAHFYDFFIKIHSGHHGDETRKFLVRSAQIDNANQARILDICCGTGSVILSFAEKYSDVLAIGYDFSGGMLHRAKQKDVAHKIILIQGDAANLPYIHDCFDVVCCSHALYELRGQVRTNALMEMKRVVKPDGKVLIMEHEVPKNPIVKMMFYMRMLMMGSSDSREFLKQDLSPYKKIFGQVNLSHTPSGKSKLVTCRKNSPHIDGK